MNECTILCLGDIVGRPGRDIIAGKLNYLKKEHGVDIVIANAENAAGGFGLTRDIARDFFDLGINIITSGNHIWKNKDIYPLITQDVRVLRPYNYPEGTPGFGFRIYDINGFSIGVLNLLGRSYMDVLWDCPFKTADSAIKQMQKLAKMIVVDFHAEATAEKQALGYYLDGKVSAVFGTHTHVQTADERILEGGAAYITDIGMCGDADGIIGTKKEQPIQRFLTGLPHKYEIGSGRKMINGIVIKLDTSTGKALSINRVRFVEPV